MASPALLVFKIFPGEDPRTPLQQVHIETLRIFSNHTSAPRRRLCYNDTNHCDLLAICDCQILKSMIFLSVLYLFVACDHDSLPPHTHLFSPILLFSKVRYQRFLLEAEIFY